MDYTNLQVQTPIGIGVLDIRNAAAATIRGVELEGTSLIGRGIEAGGHLAWLDATYDRYIAVTVEGFTGDVSGNRLNNAPELAGRVWIEWAGDIGHSRRLSLSAESTAQSTVLSSIGLTESAIDAFGTALWLVALFVFLAAGAAILFNQEWWRQLAIIGAAVSLLTIALFWQTTMILGALVDVAIVVVLVGSDWPSPALVGA